MPQAHGVEALSDDPHLSSAALCVELSLLGESFRPEFTHQCAPGERFRGCRPSRRALREAAGKAAGNGEEWASPRGRGGKSSPQKNSCALIHSSHAHHALATNELQVDIQLAPSCRTSHVAVNMTPTMRNKRRRSSAKSGPGMNQNESNGTNSQSSLHGLDDDAEAEEELTEKDIVEMVGLALPNFGNDVKSVEEDYLSSPIGKVIGEYSVQRTKSRKDDSPGRTRSKTTEKFVMSLADGQDADSVAYHNQVQKLAIWFIETGDEVDISATNSGYWKVLYIFHKLPSPKSSTEFRYALVGYMTLFHFYALFHKPNPGVIVRVCQALLLPPYQRQGHGKRLLNCVYDMAHERFTNKSRSRSGPSSPKNQAIVQVNVEDPAPAFVALRCKVDYERFAQDMRDELLDDDDNDVLGDSFFENLPESQLVQWAARTKTTPRQVQILWELLKLDAVKQIEVDDEHVQKRFRLLVKRRLNREHREHLFGLTTKEEKQSFLAERYDEDLKLYEGVLGRR